MNGIAAYGMVTSLDLPPPPSALAPGAGMSGPPAGFAGFGDALFVNRWESSAIGAVVIIALAVYANALLDAS